MRTLLKSRKFWLSIAAGVVAGCKDYFGLDQATADRLAGILVVLVGAIAAEDAAAKFGVPPPPPGSCLAFALVSWLALAGPVAAQPADVPLFDLSSLRAGPTGRQRDTGVRWPDGWRLAGVIPVLVVVEEKSGQSYFLDPEAVSLGEAEAHRVLVAVADLGITDKRTAREKLRAYLRGQLQAAAIRATLAVAARLPAALASQAPGLVEAVLKALVKR